MNYDSLATPCPKGTEWTQTQEISVTLTQEYPPSSQSLWVSRVIPLHLDPFGGRLTQEETPDGLTLKLVHNSSPLMPVPTQYPKHFVPNRALLTQPTSASLIEQAGLALLPGRDGLAVRPAVVSQQTLLVRSPPNMRTSGDIRGGPPFYIEKNFDP